MASTRAERFSLGFALALTIGVASGALYKWVDERGVVQYSDKPPDGKVKGGVAMSKGGVVVKKLETTLTPEQQKAKDEEDARRKLEERQALLQRRSDHALLQSFTSVGEIDRKRDREVQSIGIILANLRTQERNATARLDELRKRVDDHTRGGTPAPAGLLADLAADEAELKLVRSNIERRQQDVVATREHYDALKKRYLELRNPEPAGVSASTTAPAPVKK